jgi:ATP-dependent Lon protease
LAEIPDNVKRGLTIIPVSTVDELLLHALTKKLVPIEWKDDRDDPPVIPPKSESTDDHPGLITH